MSILMSEKLLIAQGDIPPLLPRNEAMLVIIVAVVIAILVASWLRMTGRREQPNHRIKLKGKSRWLEWVFSGTGMVAVFLAVLLTIIFAYILLRVTPGT